MARIEEVGQRRPLEEDDLERGQRFEDPPKWLGALDGLGEGSTVEPPPSLPNLGRHEGLGAANGQARLGEGDVEAV